MDKHISLKEGRISLLDKNISLKKDQISSLDENISLKEEYLTFLNENISSIEKSFGSEKSKYLWVKSIYEAMDKVDPDTRIHLNSIFRDMLRDIENACDC